MEEAETDLAELAADKGWNAEIADRPDHQVWSSGSTSAANRRMLASA